MTHVFAFTPTYGDALQPATVASVLAQRFGGKLTWEIGRRNPYPAPDVRNVTAQYIKARELFLCGPYDALWLVEHDMTFGSDTLAKLVATHAPVVYAPYMLRHDAPMLSAWRYENDRNLGMSLSLYPGELRAARTANIVRVSGVGFGCTLIRRHVLEDIDIEADGDGQACDIPFARACLRAGIAAVTRFDAACGHIHEGRILTIEKGGGVIARVLANTDVNVMNEGVSVALRKGHYYSLAVDKAQDLARAGYVTITNEAVTENDLVQDMPAVPAVTRRKTAIDPAKAKRKKR